MTQTIEDIKAYFHWNKDDEGNITCEYIFPNNQRFGFVLCKKEDSGWWFITKNEDGLLGAHDENFPKDFVDELRLLFNS